jgi:hypothetical protein
MISILFRPHAESASQLAMQLVGTMPNPGVKRSPNMAYQYKNSKGTTYFLHAKKRTTSTGKQQVLYFFAKAVKEGAIDALPKGYVVSEGPSGLPLLKRA